MIALDPYLMEFLRGNAMTLGALFTILIGLAKVTSWEWDEKILDVIIAPFKSILDTLSSKT